MGESLPEKSEDLSMKEQIESLDRPPTPEEKLACCMEDLNIESAASADNHTSQISSSSMQDNTEERMAEDIFWVDRNAR